MIGTYFECRFCMHGWGQEEQSLPALFGFHIKKNCHILELKPQWKWKKKKVYHGAMDPEMQKKKKKKLIVGKLWRLGLIKSFLLPSHIKVAGTPNVRGFSCHNVPMHVRLGRVYIISLLFVDTCQWCGNVLRHLRKVGVAEKIHFPKSINYKDPGGTWRFFWWLHFQPVREHTI